MTPGYWDQVGARWKRSLEAAGEGRVDTSARLRRQLVPVLPWPSVGIAITGIRGTGKNVLYDAIRGRVGDAYQPDPEGMSTSVDEFHVKTGSGRKRRATADIVPGQLDSYDQEKYFRQLFRTGQGPYGVIHVVSFGYAWTWKKEQRRADCQYLRSQGIEPDLETIRQDNLAREDKFFEVLCDELRGAWRSKPLGVWLIVAVTKCDLYWPQIDEARARYLPGSKPPPDESRFSRALRSLVDTVTEPALARVAVLPVSSWRTPFDYSAATDFDFASEIRAEPGLEKAGPREALISQLQLTIGEFNAKR